MSGLPWEAVGVVITAVGIIGAPTLALLVALVKGQSKVDESVKAVSTEIVGVNRRIDALVTGEAECKRSVWEAIHGHGEILRNHGERLARIEK